MGTYYLRTPETFLWNKLMSFSSWSCCTTWFALQIWSPIRLQEVILAGLWLEPCAWMSSSISVSSSTTPSGIRSKRLSFGGGGEKIESSKPRFKSSRMTEKASGRSTFKTFRTMRKKRKKKINRSLSTICIIWTRTKLRKSLKVSLQDTVAMFRGCGKMVLMRSDPLIWSRPS